ncbi:Prenylcysteine lyase-domain-containing protein [Flagelloscypha sp. PMI_526]|nr:Prenylcysteine lyase-domain-containing protein [Flagelloscypha sp. PMI_526]
MRLLVGLVTLLPLAQAAPKVAIVGAGAGGSSASYWIKKAKERFGVNIDIDIFEKSNYIGGRSTVVHPYNNTAYRPVELGASIFIEANKNLWRAADEFGLTRQPNEGDSENYDVGVWDGQKVVLDLDKDDIVAKYGLDSLVKVDDLIANMYSSYVNIYTTKIPRWQKISDLASSLGFSSLLPQTLLTYLRANNVSDGYSTELLEGATRVNYGQNVDAIYALEGLASLPPPYDTVNVAGGNYQIFEKFVQYSGATVHLNTAVKSILSGPGGKWVLTAGTKTYNFDYIILAAPFHQTGIFVPPSIAASIPAQPYVHLHVTLFTTTQATYNSAYFNATSPPQTMLTTANRARLHPPQPGPKFNAIQYRGKISDTESIVKIFSTQRISDQEIHGFVNNVGWVYRKEWDAYPYLPPPKSFPPIKLADGFYYVNAFEPFMSTMETETIASRNVVDLLLHDKFNGMSICGPITPPPNDSWDYVYGFDC